MTTDYSKQALTLRPQTNKSANVTMDWFAQKALYPPRTGIEITPLINGEQAFAAVHDAIQSAEKSVEIISWGFDPGMRFKPGSDRIGELLDIRGRHGVKVRTLIWKNLLANFKENTTVGDGAFGSGGTAVGSGMSRGKPASDNGRGQLEFRLEVHRHELEKLRAGELSYYNTDYKFRQRERELQSAIAQMEGELKVLNQPEGYNVVQGSGAPKRSPDEQEFTRNWFRRVHKGWMQNVEFRTRDFNSEIALMPGLAGGKVLWSERLEIMERLIAGEAPDITWKQILLLSLFPSHHQKMVLVDYENPATAVGFVMGHNMHRNYWDTSAHLFDDEAAKRSPGFGPWQDLSVKIQGPALHDLNHNFATAWDRESSWIKRWFNESLHTQRQAIKPDTFKPVGTSVAQICRTQPQEGGETSILEIYRKAIGNVRNYIYFENQYFRYADFGKQLSELAAAYKARKRKSDLYLFVVTNTPDDASFSSSTYDMMKSVGQEQLMPQTQRDLTERMLRKRNRLAYLEANRTGRDVQEQQIATLRREIAELEAQGVTPEVEKRLGGMNEDELRKMAKTQAEQGDDKKPYTLKDLPGIKVAIATLTACSPEPGQPLPAGKETWFRNIYVHSKLLVVDDVFSLLSSANINTRSLHSDSELGVATPDPKLAKKWREDLWTLHTGKSVNDSRGRCDAKRNFGWWNSVMDRNWKYKYTHKPLVAHLTRFWDVETPYATALD
ncbi:phospholipase D-like domain-containing protein [Pseudomonas leptonychotis]|uniref:phospholipase D-like domain-containing protein n=1 Tax=Pseudomonas leptonychotis TaxID=2448482 RepID=UPI0039EDF9E1